MWDGCEDVVTEAWGSSIEGGLALEIIRQQIAGCGRDLHAWGASKTHPDKEEIKHIQRLDALDHAPPTEQARNEFVELSKTLDDLLRKQEIYWHQRAWIAWMKHGDKNTKFFHAKASQRRKRNFIQGMLDQQGQWCEDITGVAGIATNYFESIFALGECNTMEECLAQVPQMVIVDMCEVLTKDYEAEEIRVALLQMDPTKAPGPDGMTTLFFQKYWHIVGDSVVSAILSYLNSGHMVNEINFTYIILIPKIKVLE